MQLVGAMELNLSSDLLTLPHHQDQDHYPNLYDHGAEPQLVREREWHRGG